MLGISSYGRGRGGVCTAGRSWATGRSDTGCSCGSRTSSCQGRAASSASPVRPVRSGCEAREPTAGSPSTIGCTPSCSSWLRSAMTSTRSELIDSSFSARTSSRSSSRRLSSRSRRADTSDSSSREYTRLSSASRSAEVCDWRRSRAKSSAPTSADHSAARRPMRIHSSLSLNTMTTVATSARAKSTTIASCAIRRPDCDDFGREPSGRRSPDATGTPWTCGGSPAGRGASPCCSHGPCEGHWLPGCGCCGGRSALIPRTLPGRTVRRSTDVTVVARRTDSGG